MTMTETNSAKLRGTRIGVVDRARTDKTRRVFIEFQARHPKYGKFIRRRTILTVHDEKNESGVGDRVEIVPCRPMSKTKRWRLVRVVETSAATEAVQTSLDDQGLAQ